MKRGLVARSLAAAALLALASCTIDRRVPNARLSCNTPRDCPAGFQCVATPTGSKVCCRAAGCAEGVITPPRLQIVDDGFDEVDLAATCSGNVCFTGGITP